MLEFDQQLKAAQERLENIQLGWDSPSLTDEHRAAAIAEVSATIEKLQAQNEELLATRQALKWERQRYQELFELATEGHIITDEQGIIQEANRVALTLLNTSKSFLLGRPLAVYLVPGDRHTFCSRLNSSSLQIEDWEVCLQPLDQKPCPATLSAFKECSPDNLTRWRWLICDLRERQQAEATAQKLEAEKKLNEFQGYLLHHVSFEFRTLLQIILISVGLLKRYLWQEAKQEQLYQSIHSSVKATVELLEEVEFWQSADASQQTLVQSKIEPAQNGCPAGVPLATRNRFRVGPHRSFLRHKIFELEPFCHSLITEIKDLTTTQSKVCFTCDRHCQVVCLDANLLRQILKNLLLNALESATEGSPIHLEVTNQADSVIFQVQASIAGIPEEQQHSSALFSEGNNRNPGAKLRLGIVKRAVDLHGGTIAFDDVGTGTTTVTLPTSQSTSACP